MQLVHAEANVVARPRHVAINVNVEVKERNFALLKVLEKGFLLEIFVSCDDVWTTDTGRCLDIADKGDHIVTHQVDCRVTKQECYN